MTEEEKAELRWMMLNEQSEGAMRDCIVKHRVAFMPLAMQIRGLYESLINVGFNGNEAIMLVLSQINK